MKKTVKSLVNKQWAAAVKILLTGKSQDTSALFTKILTATQAEQQALKSQAARDRFDTGMKAVFDAVKYGWAFGINDQQVRFQKPANYTACRRVRSLLPLAVAAGEAIGKEQASKINRAHGTPSPGTFPMRHTQGSAPA